MVFKKFAETFFAIILFSSPAYSQWFPQNSGVTTQLNSVFFTDQNTGFIASDSGKILRTTNGGTSWSVSLLFDSSISYNSISFPNLTTGYIAGRILNLINNIEIKPIIIKTTNAGLNWFSVLNDTAHTLRAVYFMNPNTGFAAGGLYGLADNYLLSTTNGGASWQNSSPGNGYLYSITFKDALTGYMTTFSSGIFKSTDAGTSWSLNQSEPASLILSMFFVDANLGFMTGGDSFGIDSSGVIYKTVNGGNNWSLVYNDHKGMINSVKFVSSQIGFAAGTFDMIAEPGNLLPGRIIKTTNSGSSWFIDTLFTNASGFTSLYFTNALTGYVVGSNGEIFKTTTGGNPMGIVPVSKDIPKEFSLSQNYPNPFNPTTTIKFSISKESFAKLSVFDILGNEVNVLVNQDLKAGEYKVSFDATNLASGVYFYKLSAGDFVSTKKLAVLK